MNAVVAVYGLDAHYSAAAILACAAVTYATFNGGPAWVWAQAARFGIYRWPAAAVAVAGGGALAASHPLVTVPGAALYGAGRAAHRKIRGPQPRRQRRGRERANGDTVDAVAADDAAYRAARKEAETLDRKIAALRRRADDEWSKYRAAESDWDRHGTPHVQRSTLTRAQQSILERSDRHRDAHDRIRGEIRQLERERDRLR